MAERSMGVRRAFALALAFVVALLFGSTSLTSAAYAAEGDMPTTPGSLTIHKYENTPTATKAGDGTELNPGPAAKPLEGVTFSVTPVTGLDLTKNADWEKVTSLTFNEQANTISGGSTTYTPGASTSQTTNAQGIATFANLPIGVYLVQETDAGSNPVTKKAAPFFVTVPYPNADGKWITNVHVYPKNDVNTPGTKEADDTNLKAIGDEIPWTITSKVSADAPSKFGVVDYLQSYLDYVKGSATVSVGGQSLNASQFTVTPGSAPAKNVRIELASSVLSTLKAGDVVTFTLKTTLNALPDGGVVKNGAFPVDGDYDPFINFNPNTDTPPIVPKEDPKYGQYQFTKVDAQTPGKPLSGAVFEICADEACTTVLAKATSDDNGVVNFPGIYIGKGDRATERTVYLRETQAPAGFTLNGTAKQITIKPGAYTLDKVDNFVNTPQHGPKLPLTGANGKVLLTIGGIAVLAMALGFILVNKRRKDA